MLVVSRIFFLTVILSPFVLILFFLPSFDLSDLSIEPNVWLNTFLQAILSAVFSVVFGCLFSLGLVGGKNLKLKEWVVLLPNFFPVLFTIFGFVFIFGPRFNGLVGILSVHTILNVGLVSVIVSRAIVSETAREVVISLSQGHDKFGIYTQVIFPRIRTTLASSFFLVFSLCMTSFSVPLVLGGGSFPTVEIRVYELLRIEGNLSAASLMALLQSLVILFLVVLLQRKKISTRTNSDIAEATNLIRVRGFEFPLYLISMVIVGIQVYDMVSGFGGFLKLLEFKDLLIHALIGTLLLGFLSGLFTIGLFAVLLFVGVGSKLRRIYYSLVAPSTAIVGFSFLLLSLKFTQVLGVPELNIYLTAFGLSLMTFGFLCRYRFLEAEEALENQRRLSEAFGHGLYRTFWHVLLPQARVDIARLAAFAAFWAVGDFAVSKMLLRQESTLGLLMESLLSRYQFEGASWVLFLILLSGSALYFLFRKSYHVAR